MPRDVAERAGTKLDQRAGIAAPAELADYDAILIGTRPGSAIWPRRCATSSTRPARCRRGALVGELGGAFVSTGTGGVNETTLASVQTTLLHHGMAIVGLPYTVPELSDISAARGGSPVGAGCLLARRESDPRARASSRSREDRVDTWRA
jgi:NAD(P)H dehydrogenase (quinone)